MSATVTLSRRATKDFKKIPKPATRRLIGGLERITASPTLGRKLKVDLLGRRRLRIGEYRIIYRYDSAEKAVEVIAIRPRGRAYK